MPKVTKLISDDLYQKVEAALKTCARFSKIHTKLQAIRVAKKFSIKNASEVFDISTTTVVEWIKSFAKNGISGLELQRVRTNLVCIFEHHAA